MGLKESLFSFIPGSDWLDIPVSNVRFIAEIPEALCENRNPDGTCGIADKKHEEPCPWPNLSHDDCPRTQKGRIDDLCEKPWVRGQYT